MWRMACCALSRPQWRATRYRPRSIAAVDPAQEIKSPSSMNSRSTTARVCGKRSRKASSTFQCTQTVRGPTTPACANAKVPVQMPSSRTRRSAASRSQSRKGSGMRPLM